MKSSERSIKVIYVGGYGRSGSTLLDSILGNHEEIFGGGELERFFADLVLGQNRADGHEWDVSPFWQEVLKRFNTKLPNLDPEQVEEDRLQIESTAGYLKHALGTSKVVQERYGEVWRTLFQTISEVSNKSVIVDSSKSSRGNSHRIHALERYAGLEVQVLHLIRDPRAVLYSEWGRGHNDRLEHNMARKSTLGGMFRPLIGWAMANMAVSASKRWDRKLQVQRVHYEALAADPVKTLKNIEEFIDIDLSQIRTLIQNNSPLDTGDGMLGNRMRRKGPIRIRLDSEWAEATPTAVRVLSRLIWPVASCYGYDVLKWPHNSSTIIASDGNQQATL